MSRERTILDAYEALIAREPDPDPATIMAACMAVLPDANPFEIAAVLQRSAEAAQAEAEALQRYTMVRRAGR